MHPSIDHRSPTGARDDLTGAQLGQIRAALQEIVDEHRRRLQENEELFRSLVADPSVDVSERERARRAAATAYETCQDAYRALQAITDGAYGRCLTCGDPIPFERLEALPLTEACVTCPHA
jgi:RNA polymerase-binding transcription factor DksA